MQSDLIVRRELYLDVTAEGSKLQEIYLYQADFLQDDSFCTKDYIFSAPVKEEEALHQAQFQKAALASDISFAEGKTAAPLQASHL